MQVNEQAQPGRSSTLFSASYGYGIAAFQETSNDRALGARTLWHDGLGQLRRWTDAKGQNFEASYDPLSRPVMRRDGVTGSSTQETKTQWVWGQSSSQHNIGRLVSAAIETLDGIYAESYLYDNVGRVSTQTISLPGDVTPYQYGFDYDSGTGSLDTLTYPTSTSGYRFALKYTRQNGILKSISDANSPATVFWSLNEGPGGIDAFGQITDDILGNGIFRQRLFDALTGSLERITAGTSVGDASLQNASIGYDDFGNVTQRQSGLASLPNSLIEDFEYGEPSVDHLDRLTHVELTSGTTTETRDYDYDAFGNIELLTTSESATPSDRVPVDLSITWTSYNYPGRIEAPWLSESATFAYGPDRRRWRMVYEAGSKTETTYYLGGLMEKVVTDGSSEFRHYIPGPTGMLGLYSRSASGPTPLSYLLGDHQGSLDTITDAVGGNPIRTAFTPFGVPRDPVDWSGAPASMPDSITRQGYTFQTVLGRMGLNHMNGRVQDAISGTFLSPDPFVPDPLNTQAFNRYAYVYNNPLTRTDLSGFDPDDYSPGWDLIDDLPGSPSALPPDIGYELIQRYDGWKGYMWAVAGINTGGYDCDGSYEQCSRGWRQSPFYTTVVTNPLHPAFPAHSRPNANVSIATGTQGADRRATASTVGGTISPYTPLFRDNFAGRTLQSIDYSLGWLTQAAWDGPVRGLFSNLVPTPKERNEAAMGVVLAAIPVSRLAGGLSAARGTSTLFRAVGPDELADIQSTGALRSIAGLEGKYFTTSAEAASSYARQAVRAFGDPPYTIIRVNVSNDIFRGLTPATVDGGIPAWVIPNSRLPGLTPQVLDVMPIPGM